MIERQEFHARDQQEHETVDQHLAALIRIDSACAYSGEDELLCMSCMKPCGQGGQFRETRLRDRLICGLRDKELRRRILQETYNEELKLTKEVTFCQAAEMSEQSDCRRNLAVDTELAISAVFSRSSKLSERHSNKT